jgi:hypothetical protein
MNSIDEISSMFSTESEKLQNLINNATKSELSVHEIVETYYQIMNVSSMIAMIKQLEKHKELLSEILETENMISEKFNSQIHPKILDSLSKSIQDTMKNIQSATTQKSKEDIENNAKRFEELREKMSTKEFVEQYDQGLLK